MQQTLIISNTPLFLEISGAEVIIRDWINIPIAGRRITAAVPKKYRPSLVFSKKTLLKNSIDKWKITADNPAAAPMIIA